MPPQDSPDSVLNSLIGTEVPSNFSPDVRYRIDGEVGAGAMSVAFLAQRIGPDGQCPVVLKVLRPAFVRTLGPDAHLVVQKEAVALGRLNERVPTTPFVVRLIDTGAFLWGQGPRSFELLWIAVEYVHGGFEGTTLADRVEYSIRSIAQAFDSRRASLAIECLAKGLSAVHEVGVIHRDIKPDNVLCCGFGLREIFKVADFGVARPNGVVATFFGGLVGTPGYAAPEFIDLHGTAVGPWSDVFAFASVVYFLLTGEEYFPVRTVAEGIIRVREPRRRSILESPSLSLELRERPVACAGIDAALAHATSLRPETRPQTAEAFASSVLAWLRTDSFRRRPVARRIDSLLQAKISGWTWVTRQNAGADFVVRSVAWDSDGTCLAATSDGLVFWDGTSLREAPLHGLLEPKGIRFVRRIGAGRWIVGCDGGIFGIYTPEGMREVTQLADVSVQLTMLSGDIHDLAVASGYSPDGVVLLALAGRRWLRPLIPQEVESISSIARVGDARWLVAGRAKGGGGYAGIYCPTDWDIVRLESPTVRAFLVCAGQAEHEVGVIGGADGAVLWYQDGAARLEDIGTPFDVSAAAIDSTGRGWLAGAGRIVCRSETNAGMRWACAWEDRTWTAPIISLFADDGIVIAMTADGGILEGRGPR